MEESIETPSPATLRDRNPKEVVARSTALFKKTWGQTIAAHVGLVAIPIIVLLLSGILATFLCLMTSLIFQMTLYVYATEGVVPEEYAGDEAGWFVAR